MKGEHYVIQGGAPLRGAVAISGAKNAAVALTAACLLTEEECLIENVPQIEDVAIMGDVLRSLGATVTARPGELRVRARGVEPTALPESLVQRNRASFLAMGSLLARFGEACSYPPGGDVIGERPVDVHLAGFAALGAEITRDDGLYRARASRLRGAEIYLDYPSVMGTENLMLAASLAEGTTVLRNAAAEPEVQTLADMLRAMGARIQGAGSNTIEIEGVRRLVGVRHRTIPDRIEAGTFALAAAATRGEVELEMVMPEHLGALCWKLRQAGAEVLVGEHTLKVSAPRALQAVNVQAVPYPGFASDLQAAMGVLLTQAVGQSVIHERVYDNRLRYVEELRRMGAQVQVEGQTAIIHGPTALHGAEVTVPDIRAGAALVIAGLVAEGETIASDIFHLDRGYERLDAKLGALGASISRYSPPEAGPVARRVGHAR